ncbi:MAG TPA: hypothetical protein PKL70_11620 [Saprospiraceae bacterium]|nr:hypothetical protein [Saprospiraceae bacterium]
MRTSINNIRYFILVLGIFIGLPVYNQTYQQKLIEIDLKSLYEKNELTLVNRQVKWSEEKGQDVIELLLNEDEGLAWIKGIEFKTGTIELRLKGIDVYQHSFLGIAFHGVNDSTFDALYFRPFQFLAEDTVRKKRAIQYISLPQYTWSRLRETQNGKFENQVVPAPDPNDWFHARFIISETEARVYVNDTPEPYLIVPLLGAKSGKIGLYTAYRSGGSFANLRIIKG